jgi:hypothetical protein
MAFLTRADNIAAIAEITLRTTYGDLGEQRRAAALVLIKRAVADAAERCGGAYSREESEAVEALMRRLVRPNQH